MDCSPPGSSVRGILQQEYWSGLPFLLQGIFLAQGLNPGLLHCRQILYHLRYREVPMYGAPNTFKVNFQGFKHFLKYSCYIIL